MKASNFLRSLLVVVAVSASTVVVPTLPTRVVGASTAVEYYYNAGRRIPVHRSSSRVAVLAEPSSKAGVAGQLAGEPSIAAVREVGATGLIEVTIGATSAGKAPLGEVVANLEASGHVVVPVYFEPGVERDASTLFVTDEVLAMFSADVSAAEAEELASAAGLSLVEPLRYAANGYRLRLREADFDRTVLAAANALFESGRCRFAHPNFVASRSLRFRPNDPAYADQWHLRNTGQGGGVAGADVEAEAAWDITQGSPDVIVAVADTGIDTAHPDLAVNVGDVPKIVAPRDVVHADDDPAPKPGDANNSHGTAAAGVAIAAFNNGRETAGIAPMCRFMPIQLYAESTFTPNSTEADAFTWAADNGAAVMSNSWGPDNDDTPLPDATRAAMEHATTNGRGGKGMVILFAAGNSNDDTDRDNYVSSEFVIGVAASTNFDTRAGYSRFGSAVSISAPSSGGSLGITTTDLSGSGGYSSGNFTGSFGGTSSACPLAAGIAALMLSVNPDLTWTEVKQVLEQTADKIDPDNANYNDQGFSVFYGYGRVNAFRAVEMALELVANDNPRVTVASPATPAGAGGMLSLDWVATAEADLVSQDVSFSTDGGSTFTPIAMLDGASRSFDWTVPDDVSGSVRLRVTATDTESRTGSSTITVSVWAKPVIGTVKLKRTSSGRRTLVVDGAAFRTDTAVIFVGETPLGLLKYPNGRRNADGTCTRIVSKDGSIDSLIPSGSTVQITVRHAVTGQVSTALSFTR